MVICQLVFLLKLMLYGKKGLISITAGKTGGFESISGRALKGFKPGLAKRNPNYSISFPLN